MIAAGHLQQQLRAVLSGLGPRVPYTDAGMDQVRRHIVGTIETGGFEDITVTIDRLMSPLELACNETAPGLRASRRRRRARRRLLRAITRGWRSPRRIEVRFTATAHGAIATMKLTGQVTI